MDTITYDRDEEDWDTVDEKREEGEYHLPARPRRKLLNGKTAALIAVLTAAAGFYGGVRVEKGQINSTPVLGGAAAGGSARAGLAALAARFRAGGATGGTGTGASATAAPSGGAGGAAAGGGGFGAAGGRGFAGVGGGGNLSFGTVSSVNGDTLYITDSSGNTVKVVLSGSTKLSKTENVSRHAVRPGDTVVVSGLKNSSGALVATTVTDSGARAGAAAGSGSGSSGAGSTGGGSGVSSLFQSGGGG